MFLTDLIGEVAEPIERAPVKSWPNSWQGTTMWGGAGGSGASGGSGAWNATSSSSVVPYTINVSDTSTASYFNAADVVKK